MVMVTVVAFWVRRFIGVFAAFLVLLALDPSGSSVGAQPIGENGRLDLCKTDLSTFLPVPYSNMSGMTCKPVWNNFMLRYLQSEDNVLTIILSAVYTTGWVGMGFSKEGMMAGSSAMVGWIGKEGHAVIKQYYLRAPKPSEVIANKGELPLTNVPAAVAVHEASIYLAFQMKFAQRLANQPILLAFSTKLPVHHQLSVHTDKSTFNFDFSAGSMGAAPDSPIGAMKRNHGILGIFGWGLILPVGAIAPRYFKHRDPQWFYFHTIVQFMGFIIGLATIVVGKALYDKINADIPIHRGIGITVLALSVLQIMAFFLRPDKDAKIRKYWNWYHHWFGRIALFLGALNIVLGIKVGGAGNPWKVGYGFVLASILITIVVLEILLRMRSREKKVPPSFQMNPI